MARDISMEAIVTQREQLGHSVLFYVNLLITNAALKRGKWLIMCFLGKQMVVCHPVNHVN